MVELDKHTYYKVMLITDRGECPGFLKFDDYRGEWRLAGMSGYCASLWDLVERKPTKITLRLTHKLLMQEFPSEEPLSEGLSVRFFGVQWVDYDCSSQTIFCGGKSHFRCDFHVVEQDELVPDCVVG